jgi:hypothetical protein
MMNEMGDQPVRLQFSVGQLLSVVTWMAVCFGAGRILNSTDIDSEPFNWMMAGLFWLGLLAAFSSIVGGVTQKRIAIAAPLVAIGSIALFGWLLGCFN